MLTEIEPGCILEELSIRVRSTKGVEVMSKERGADARRDMRRAESGSKVPGTVTDIQVCVWRVCFQHRVR